MSRRGQKTNDDFYCGSYESTKRKGNAPECFFKGISVGFAKGINKGRELQMYYLNSKSKKEKDPLTIEIHLSPSKHKKKRKHTQRKSPSKKKSPSKRKSPSRKKSPAKKKMTKHKKKVTKASIKKK